MPANGYHYIPRLFPVPLFPIKSLSLSAYCYMWQEPKNPERATPMMGLYHKVLVDRFIFRYIFDHLFPQENGISRISTPFMSSFAHLN